MVSLKYILGSTDKLKWPKRQFMHITTDTNLRRSQLQLDRSPRGCRARGLRRESLFLFSISIFSAINYYVLDTHLANKINRNDLSGHVIITL